MSSGPSPRGTSITSLALTPRASSSRPGEHPPHCPAKVGERLPPVGLCGVVEGEESADHDGQVDTPPALARPVHVAEVEEQGELVDDQRRADPEGDGEQGMPPRLIEGEGEEAADEDETDAPYIVVDVEAT